MKAHITKVEWLNPMIKIHFLESFLKSYFTFIGNSQITANWKFVTTGSKRNWSHF